MSDQFLASISTTDGATLQGMLFVLGTFTFLGGTLLPLRMVHRMLCGLLTGGCTAAAVYVSTLYPDKTNGVWIPVINSEYPSLKIAVVGGIVIGVLPPIVGLFRKPPGA